MPTARSGSIVIFLLALAWGAGCASPFPAEMVARADRSITLSALRASPDRHRGSWVLLGGMVVSVKNTQDGSFLEILQRPLTGRGKPLRTDRTEGRFIVRSPEFLDPAVYLPGRDITVIGEAIGSRSMPLDGIPYDYPVLTLKTLHLWDPASQPRFSIGIGVGVTHIR